jgi:hypothetical protein
MLVKTFGYKSTHDDHSFPTHFYLNNVVSGTVTNPTHLLGYAMLSE